MVTRTTIPCNVAEGRFELEINGTYFNIIDIAATIDRGTVKYHKRYRLDLSAPLLTGNGLIAFNEYFAYHTTKCTTLDDLVSLCENSFYLQ